MTEQEKKQLYESIMRDVAQIVKQRINEYSSNICVYKQVMNWLHDVDAQTLKLVSEKEYISETLEPQFRNNASILLKELQQWFSDNSYIDPKTQYFIKNVEFILIPGNIELKDIVVYNPEQKFMNIIDSFMNKRDYKMMFYKIENDGNPIRLHIVYSPKKDIEVDFNKINTDFIYHITPTKNVENIKSNGFLLTSRHGEGSVYYDNRTYFFLYEQNADAYRYSLQNEYKTGKLTKLMLLVSDVKNIKFYYDPLLIDSVGIFTESRIIDTSNMICQEYKSVDYKRPPIDDDEYSLIAAYLKDKYDNE